MLSKGAKTEIGLPVKFNCPEKNELVYGRIDGHPCDCDETKWIDGIAPFVSIMSWGGKSYKHISSNILSNLIEKEFYTLLHFESLKSNCYNSIFKNMDIQIGWPDEESRIEYLNEIHADKLMIGSFLPTEFLNDVDKNTKYEAN